MVKFLANFNVVNWLNCEIKILARKTRYTIYHVYLYDIIDINTRFGFASYSCNNYDIILVPCMYCNVTPITYDAINLINNFYFVECNCWYMKYVFVTRSRK